MSAIALSEELLPLLVAHRVEHHFSRSNFITCSRKQVTMRRRSSRFSNRDLLSSCFSPSFLRYSCFYRGISMSHNIPLIFTCSSYSAKILPSSVLHSLDRTQFATIDHHRGRSRRQLVASKSAPQLESVRYDCIWKNHEHCAIDDPASHAAGALVKQDCI